MIQHRRPSERILVHELGVPLFPKAVAIISGTFLTAAIAFRSLSLGVLGILAAGYWVLRERQLRREREDDERRTLRNNYPCSKCGTLLRVRQYAVNEDPINGDYSTARHLDCLGYYCYFCKNFDQWPLELSLKESEAKRRANGL